MKPDQPLQPHPTLPDYYPDLAQRPAFVRGLFDRTARHYDYINRLLSFGSGGWYRRRALRRVGLRPGMTVLDVAIGTGLVARQALAIARGQYKAGLTTFLNVLQSEASLFQSQDKLAQSGQRLAVQTIALYKALGAGWPSNPPPSIPQT